MGNGDIQASFRSDLFEKAMENLKKVFEVKICSFVHEMTEKLLQSLSISLFPGFKPFKNPIKI